LLLALPFKGAFTTATKTTTSTSKVVNSGKTGTFIETSVFKNADDATRVGGALRLGAAGADDAARVGGANSFGASTNLASDFEVALKSNAKTFEEAFGGSSVTSSTGNTVINSVGSVNGNIISELIENGKATLGNRQQIITTLNDGTKVIIRKDFGENAHKLGNPINSANAVDHYNLEVQVPYRNGYRKIEDIHIIPTEDGYKWFGDDKMLKGK